MTALLSDGAMAFELDRSLLRKSIDLRFFRTECIAMGRSVCISSLGPKGRLSTWQGALFFRTTGPIAYNHARMADQDLYSGLIRLHVLFHASEGPIFGLGMIRELRRHGYRVGPGTLYPILHRLESKGYLRSKQQLVERKMRRTYVITSRGTAALGDATHKVRELHDEMIEGDGHYPRRGGEGAMLRRGGEGDMPRHGGEGSRRNGGAGARAGNH